VKDKPAAVADWPRWIETIVFVNRNVISARHLACPIVVWANTVRVSCIERFIQILAHQITAIVRAAEALERTVFQSDWLKLGKNCLAQFASCPVMHEITNEDAGCGRENDYDQCDAGERSFDESVLHRSRPVKTILALVITTRFLVRVK
jgi:hypothetical protein